jgi:cysteinyl-tRNA synthetase
MDGRKMAKSAGNFQRVTELAERGIDPLAYRYLVLTSRYRHKLEYSDESLDAAAAALASLRARLVSLGPPPADGPWAASPVLEAGAAPDRPIGVAAGPAGHGRTEPVPLTDRAHAPAAPLSIGGQALHDRFVAALDDDLDMPTALAVVRETLRADLSADERRWLVLDADFVLGLGLDGVWAAANAGEAPGVIPTDVLARVESRDAARRAGDYATADAIRDALASDGWLVTDSPDGPRVSRSERGR